MHASRRMSSNLVFCGKTPQREALGLLRKGLGKKLVSPALLTALPVLSFTSCPGGLPNPAQRANLVRKHGTRQISFSTGPFANELAKPQLLLLYLRNVV